ncbi:unnamed protein product [Urochloa decumbens]|uniref:Uncharacterized protein n=1 Tax=Urochloa decumbens TaxID=240449 RepID=A0ABC9BTF8_9POAL
MYTTKPLSLFRSHQEAAAEPLPEGPNAGYLVVKSARDEEDDEQTMCWGVTRRVRALPFPQNRVLKVQYGEDEEAVVFVPVPDQPLASNRYYVVGAAKGSRKGLLRACSREEDMATCCFGQCVTDVEPRPFDPADAYQQIEVVQHSRGLFTAKAVAADGVPPSIYRSKYWEVYESTKKIDIGVAPGLDVELRSRQLAGPVGKWYCPFFLIREHGVPPRKQVDRSALYEVVLEQRWEPVRGDAVRHGRDISKVASRKVLVGGSVGARSEAARSWHDGAYVWYVAATGERVGVCTTVWERMLWEQSRGGWVDEEKEAGSVANGLVLVERFVVKRMDTSEVVAFDFVHHDKVKVEQGCS